MDQSANGRIGEPHNSQHERRVIVPACDVFESETGILLHLDVPGADQEGLEITVEKGVLSIYARRHATSIQGYEQQYAEYHEGDYQRKFALSDEVNTEKISASIKNGGLKIVLPKLERHPSRRIVVNAQ